MKGLWILPSFDRKERLAGFIKSWLDTEGKDEVVLSLSENDPRLEELQNLNYPPGWTVFTSPSSCFTEAVNNAYAVYGKEYDYVGLLCDDVVLQTKNWDRTLGAVACTYGIAYPNDLYQEEKLCTFWCVRADILNCVGFFSPPWLKHMGTDVVWYNIGLNCNCIAYCKDVIFEHQHWYNKKAGVDTTYQKGQACLAGDNASFELNKNRLEKVILNVKELLHEA